ncbi:LysR family transcriptional regulator [Chitinasiproducens palmae]|uniref:DNA-binding transcriptional regulator, LysR family n=1 Tax=Chitinasiproducens palmae TaxID=1770053 RepID=A0A1H2PKM9_9BURK|nr:LysR family transcriptional regulator [Chitinasiproducens palmae]SDV46561.1 DNA-binding transcriptional regulator, LysR family [Chitinasiproducens palmae]
MPPHPSDPKPDPANAPASAPAPARSEPSAGGKQSPALRAGVRFDLTTMRLFAATAELGNITHASGRLHLVPAAASRRIRELEEQLGLPLFVRLPHGMALTDAGRAMLAHARSLLHAVERMQDDAAAFLHGERGIVRVAACTSAVLQFLPSDIAACAALHPDIRIDLQEMNSERVIQAVRRGVADLGVYEPSVGSVRLPTHAYRADRLCAVALRSHPLAARAAAGVTIEMLLDHDLIGLTEGASVSITLARLAEAAGRALRMRIRVGSFDSMAAMIAGGFGIGLMPEAVARQIAAAEQFVHLPIDGEWAARRFVLCHQPRDSLALAAEPVIASLIGAPLAPG